MNKDTNRNILLGRIIDKHGKEFNEMTHNHKITEVLQRIHRN